MAPSLMDIERRRAAAFPAGAATECEYQGFNIDIGGGIKNLQLDEFPKNHSIHRMIRAFFSNGEYLRRPFSDCVNKRSWLCQERGARWNAPKLRSCARSPSIGERAKFGDRIWLNFCELELES